MTEKQFNKKWRSNPKHYNSDELASSVDENGHKIDIALVYSGRNRGKSFDISSRALEDAWKSKGAKQFGYVRRHEKELKLSNVEKYFDDKIEFIKDLTNNDADSITVLSDGIYFSKEELDNGKMKKVPILKCGDYFSLSCAEQYKSLQYPKITRLILEEVFTNGRYLPNEVDSLLSIISTIKRSRTDFTCFLISNTVSRVNPYTQGLSLRGMLKQKPGTIDFYKLYKGTFDEEGNEEYYYIATEYLKDADNEIDKRELLGNRNRLTSISSNSWDELHQYVHCTNKLICQYFTEEKAVFEWNNDRFMATICTVPYNIEQMIDGYKNDEEVTPDERSFPVLYVERKTSMIKEKTRTYTNLARVNPYVSLRFRRMFAIDEVIQDIISKGHIIYADNLTGNEFNQILKELY